MWEICDNSQVFCLLKVAHWKVRVTVPALANPSGSVAGMTNHVQPSCSLLPGCCEEERLREQGAMKRIR